MKLASIVFAAAAAFAAVSAQDAPADTPATVAPAPAGGEAPAAGAAAGPAPATGAAPAANAGGAAPAAGAGAGSKATTPAGPAGAQGPSPLDSFKATKHKSEYHMEPVRVVHARVQSDTPALIEGAFVSSFGGGDLKKGYLSAMDNVNTASVEGALMYVQAEGINVNSRSERCVRKTNMQHIVFYEIAIAQTNETIAQFQESWETAEYGPMIPMDGGRCTPLLGDSKFPAECYQFNGDNGQPNLGPFVGGGNKVDDKRAPYPGNYWFSFPNTCPTATWKEKNETCRENTRKGLCDYGVLPDGVECTFAYNILGWVPIDDVIGITQLTNAEGNPYKNFTEWCNANESHIEFAGDDKTGEMKEGLSFWENPTDQEANKARAQAVLDAYTSLLTNKNSTQVKADLVESFRQLPTPEELAAKNPPCYKSVKSCGTGNGCKRVGYSQLCTPCKDGEKCETSDAEFKFPELEKAPTTLSEDELKTSSSQLNDGMGSKASGGKDSAKGGDKAGSKTDSASVQATVAAAAIFGSLLVSALAL